MEVVEAVVREADEVAPSLVSLSLDCLSVARASRQGQFLMVRCGEGLDPFLPRPFSVAGLSKEEPAGPFVRVLIEPVGQGSGWLAARRPGDAVIVTGPLGRPLQLEPGVRHLLLIGEGSHVAPLLFLGDEAVAHGVNVTFLQVLGAGPVYPAALLPAEVEVVSLESAAQLSNAGEHLRWADQVVAAGDEHLLRHLAGELKRHVIRRPAQAFPRLPFPCGTGICGSCVVETRQGLRLLCRDGAWLELRALA